MRFPSVPTITAPFKVLPPSRQIPLLLALVVSAGCSTVPHHSLVVAPSMQATLPDGTVIHPVLVVPRENVLNKNEAFQDWERAWPRTYQLRSR